MDTVRVQYDGSLQIINIPDNYKFSTDELYINKIGNVIMLLPKNDQWAGVFMGLDMFSDDFMEDGRGELQYEARETL